MSQNPSDVIELDLWGRLNVEPQLAAIDRLSSLLQTLRLDDCTTLTDLRSELCDLHSLKVFSTQNCQNLKELPSNFGQLKNLENLNISHCSALKELPSTFDQLPRLKILNLSHCDGLKYLPSSFGTLTSLQHLDLSFCDSLSNLPQTFGNLLSLQTLSLEFCQNLVNLPSNFDNLCSLERLILTGCEDLEKLPTEFGKLKSLRWLEFRQDRSICSGMETLPESFGELSCLEELTLRCPNLENLPQSFVRLKKLSYLDLSGCENLCSFPDNFRELECLTFLNIQFCFRLERLWDDSGSLISLKAVNAADCYLDGNALDRFVEVRGLMLLYIAGSERLIERWKQVKNENVLWVICERPAAEVDCFDWDGFEVVARETKSTAFFYHGCKFLDGEGKVEDDSFPAVSTKLAILFSMHDMSSSCLEILKKKSRELVSENFQLIYVAAWEQSEEDIQRTLPGLLPPGSQALAWVGGGKRSRDIFGFSVIFSMARREKKVERLGAFIATTSVSVDEEGNKCLGDLETVFPEEEDGNDLKALLDSAGGFKKLYDPISDVIHRMVEA